MLSNNPQTSPNNDSCFGKGYNLLDGSCHQCPMQAKCGKSTFEATKEENEQYLDTGYISPELQNLINELSDEG